MRTVRGSGCHLIKTIAARLCQSDFGLGELGNGEGGRGPTNECVLFIRVGLYGCDNLYRSFHAC